MTTTGSYTPDNLVVGSLPTITNKETIVSGQDVSRGCVLGKITSGGKLTACDHTAQDGSATPYAVLVEDCDASLADKTNIAVYVLGCFNSDKLSFGGSSTISDLKAAMRLVGLYVQDES